MNKIAIDGVEYNLDELSNEAKAQIASLQFVDGELVRLNAQAAALQTARVAYSNELKRLLATSSDTIKFN